MTDVVINDRRLAHEFAAISFSNFKKADVKKELLASLIASKIEQSCYWSAELVAAGHFGDLWDTILLFYARHVHIGAPKIALYLSLKIQQFRGAVGCAGGISRLSGPSGAASSATADDLALRNDPAIRRMFAEIMCILCDAKHKPGFTAIKVRREDFDIAQMRAKFKATASNLVEVMQPEDPKELAPAINEIAHAITVRDAVTAFYWIEWIFEFDTICRSRGERIRCEPREFAAVEPKYQSDVAFIIWDLLLTVAAREAAVRRIMDAALDMFTLRYTSKRRRYVLYFAVSLLCEDALPLGDEIIRASQREMMGRIIGNVDLIYKQIKKNEVMTLSEDAMTSNLQQTIAKLETMNTFGETFVPRGVKSK